MSLLLLGVGGVGGSSSPVLGSYFGSYFFGPRMFGKKFFG